MYPNWVDPSCSRRRRRRWRPTTRLPRRRRSPTAGFTYKGNKLIDPKGDPVSFQIHVIGGWSDWVASLHIITQNLQAVGIDASRQARARLGRVAAERDEHEVRDAALELRQPDITPYAYFYVALRPVANLGAGVGRVRDRQLGALLRRAGCRAAPAVQGHPRPGEAEADRLQARGDLPRQAAVHPAVHRAALVDLQHEVLHGLPDVEEPVRRPDLHDLEPGARRSCSRSARLRPRSPPGSAGWAGQPAHPAR